MSSTVRLIDLGRREYGDVWALQRELHAAVAEGRESDTWLIVEHDPVITLGRNAKDGHVHRTPAALASRGVGFYTVERGGDATYHGPGQVVVYPIMKLKRFREVVPLVSALESAAIASLATFGIEAHTRSEHRGVYVGANAICAVGLAVRRMTSLHGIALNASTALDYDRLITPCGTPQFGITSIANELGRPVGWSEARDSLIAAMARRFDVEPIDVTPSLTSALHG